MYVHMCMALDNKVKLSTANRGSSWQKYIGAFNVAELPRNETLSAIFTDRSTMGLGQNSVSPVCPHQNSLDLWMSSLSKWWYWCCHIPTPFPARTVEPHWVGESDHSEVSLDRLEVALNHQLWVAAEGDLNGLAALELLALALHDANHVLVCGWSWRELVLATIGSKWRKISPWPFGWWLPSLCRVRDTLPNLDF